MNVSVVFVAQIIGVLYLGNINVYYVKNGVVTRVFVPIQTSVIIVTVFGINKPKLATIYLKVRKVQ